jgi:hypothetical protein
MKNIIIVIIIFLVSYNAVGQITELHFGVNVKERLDKMSVLIPNPYIYNPYQTFDDLWVTALGLTYRYKYTLMFEYSNEGYVVGAGVKQPEGKINLWGTNVDECKTFNLSLGYKLLSEKSKLNILPQLGFSYSISSYYNSEGGIIPDTSTINYTELGIVYKQFLICENQIDKGFNKGYFFLKPRIEFTYTPFYYFTLFFNSGYNFGFKPIGYVRGWYQINEEPKVDIKSSYSGNYFYFGLGARLNFKLKKMIIK